MFFSEEKFGISVNGDWFLFSLSFFFSSFQTKSFFSGCPTWKSTTRRSPICWWTVGKGNPWKWEKAWTWVLHRIKSFAASCLSVALLWKANLCSSPQKSVYVADLTEEVVTSSAQVLAWIRKGESECQRLSPDAFMWPFCLWLLTFVLFSKNSLENRRYGKTKMNQRSSRSHTIFRMVRAVSLWARASKLPSLSCFYSSVQILESRERSDPASSEGADGAIIVSNLVSSSSFSRLLGSPGFTLKFSCRIWWI